MDRETHEIKPKPRNAAAPKRESWETGPLAPVRWGWRRELPLALLVLAVAAFTRFYRIGDIPYGIEGDEATWTVEAATLAVDGAKVLDAEYHSFWLPASFAMQAPFHQLLGPSIRAARIEVAFFSLLATAVFYWLVRQAVNSPVALIATFLLAVSVVDMSASRLALVEAHVKLWAVLSPALALAAWRRKSTLLFLACGIALALGLLTYETFAPMVGVVLACVGAKAWGERADWRRWAEHLSALLLPVILIAPRFITYLQGRAEYYALPRRGLADPPLVGLARGLIEVLHNFYRQTTGDFLIVQSGPIIHPLLTPLLVIGLAYTLAHIRRRDHLLPAAWFLLVLLPVPTLLRAPYVRILYPGFPAMYMLIAIALWGITWKLRRQSAASADNQPSSVILALALAALGVYNWNYYLHEVHDPAERQARREMADLVAERARTGQVIYAPYYSEVEDPLYANREVLRFAVRSQSGASGPDTPGRLLHLLPFDAALAELSIHGTEHGPVAVLHDKSTSSHGPERQAFADTLQRCYPGAAVATGRFFDIYTLSVEALAAPVCGSARVAWAALPQGASFPAGQPLVLFWQVEGRAPTTARIVCERLPPGALRIEAEDFVKLEGWADETRNAAGYSGRAFVVDDVNARAALTTSLAEAGQYRVWARWYRAAPGGPPAMLRIGDHTLSFGASGEIGRWVWQPSGSLSLPSGSLILTLSRETLAGQAYVPLFVDAVLFVHDPVFDPEQESEWASVADSGENALNTTPPYAYTFTGEPGAYRCRAQAFSGDWLVDSQGQRGVWSDWIYFSIR